MTSSIAQYRSSELKTCGIVQNLKSLYNCSKGAFGLAFKCAGFDAEYFSVDNTNANSNKRHAPN